MRLLQWPVSYCREALGFLYPLCCPWCGCVLKDGVQTHLCENCQQKIAPLHANRCRRCSATVGPFVNTDNGCSHCSSDRLHFESVISLGNYDGELKKVCLRCKQVSLRPLVSACGSLLFEREKSTIESWKVDLVIPVPHHWTDRLRQQDPVANTLADELARIIGVPTDRHLLFKRKRTEKQQGKSATDRRRNLQGAFCVHPRARLSGLRVLLTDDVLTSGTTASRVTRVLVEAGVKTVFVAVLARTLLK